MSNCADNKSPTQRPTSTPRRMPRDDDRQPMSLGPAPPQCAIFAGEDAARVHSLDTAATQRYCCVVLPSIDAATGNLPPGVHEATWPEIVAAFGSTAWRLELLAGL